MKSASVNNINRLGGKGAHLHWMKEHGFPVPDFIIIPVDGYQDDKLRPEVGQQLKDFLMHHQDSDFAVRSSATVEDGSAKSYAGQFKSFLHVCAEEVPRRIEAVHASAQSENIKRYHGKEGLKMAVVVQKMMAADVSGVVFGVNPVSGNLNETVISATYGLGEGLVSGDLDGDTFTYTNGNWSSQLATKTEKLELRDGNINKVQVEEAKMDEPSLDEDELEKLLELSESLKGKLGAPQDVEFCFKDGELYLLQTRPITGLQTQNRTIWDNSNIIESYPGVTTPLTFSFILRMYHAVYEQLTILMGVPAKKVERNQEIYANMLGLLRGRVYYNLINWYKALAMVPGFQLNARFMEKMMGTSETFDLPESAQDSAWATKKQFAVSIFKLIAAYRRLPKDTEKFQTHLNGVMERYEALDMGKLAAWELLEKIEQYQEVLLRQWKAPLVNDFFAMIYFGMYQKNIEKWYTGDYQHIHNDLLIGSSDIISAEPIKFFREVDEAIRQQPETKKVMKSLSAEEAYTELHNDKHKQVWKIIEGYLARFGDRAVGELKLETETYRQNPALLIQRIQENLNHEPRKKEGDERFEIRAKAEKELFGNVKGWFKKSILRYLLKNTRRLVSNRENLRYERTRAFGMMRRLFLAIGQKMASAGLIEAPRDIFYLEEKEIFNYLKGTATTINLKELVAMRKEEFNKYKEEDPLPERIETLGWIYPELKSGDGVVASGDLKGLPCCAGVVKAKVRVIRDPSEAAGLNGEILVTSSTDPGWISLFYGASGILVERGSLLSHSAIVSREMGIPCIVSVKGLLATLKDGDEVEMNGSTGEIRILGKR
jgi:pyruvate,water dikinase